MIWIHRPCGPHAGTPSIFPCTSVQKVALEMVCFDAVSDLILIKMHPRKSLYNIIVIQSVSYIKTITFHDDSLVQKKFHKKVLVAQIYIII